jgi:hypothetical protein
MADMTDDSKKAWYQKPENILTYGGIAAGGYIVLKELDVILPLLNRVLENVIYTSVLAGTIAVLGWVVVSNDFHRLVWLGYKSAMRWMTSFIVELDPIGVMRNYVAQLKKNLKDIAAALSALRGQKRNLEQLIEQKAAEHDKSMSLAAQAKARADQKGMKTEMQLQFRKAGRAEKSNMTYQGLLNTIKKHLAIMEKVEEAANFMITDIEDTVDEESKKREMIHASFKAMSASRRILAGDKQRELYDMALESTTKDYYSKLGEIEQFMSDSQSFINGMDLENGVVEADALAKLEQWEQRSSNLLEGGSGKTKFRVSPVNESHQEDADEEPEKEKRQSFADLFEKLDK